MDWIQLFEDNSVDYVTRGPNTKRGEVSMLEIWLPVKGFEKYYQISNLGRLRSLEALRHHGGYRPRVMKAKLLSTKLPKTGKYRKIQLYGDIDEFRELRLHVLVAEHFIPNPLNLKFVCHKDDDKANNKADNLYWGDAKSNMQDKSINGLAGKKLTDKDVRNIKKYLIKNAHKYRRKEGGLYRTLAKKYNVKVSTLYAIRDGRTWRHI
jgi:NUMOD4 motif/HNH endonuclease